MSAWKIANEHSSVGWDGTGWTAVCDNGDGLTARMDDVLAGSIPITPVGPFYVPKSEDDELAVYLAARWVLAEPWTITGGKPPALPLDAPVDGLAY